MGVNLDHLDDDLKLIERYVRERDRQPGRATLMAFQRVALLLPDMVAEIRQHRAECVSLQPGNVGGWFVRCPLAGEPGRVCNVEWASHDLIAAERVWIHFTNEHQLDVSMANTLMQSLYQSGRLPRVSNE